MQKELSAGLYIRLSKEDDRDGPSESVTNQRVLLQQYTNEHRITVYDTYIDDGWSGCNFNRPAFQRLLNDIEAGYVNTVITKDLSRLGRDYILTGHYLERYFPEHGVRYISLLDGIDTAADTSANDITPFRAIMNDLYARDISRKIIAVKRDKQRRGEFIGGKPIFGYRMHPTKKNHLIIDEPAADVVRRIFAMALTAANCRSIADALNADGVPSPSIYAMQKNSAPWSGERIGEMLRNEIYLGNMVQGRRIKASYKSSKCLRRKKEDWIVVAETHEAIIDRATYDAVQRILTGRKRTRSRTYHHPLKGLLFCSECGHPLSLINRKNAAGEDTLYFICRTNNRLSNANRCSSHCVKASTVTDVVISSILSTCERELSRENLIVLAQKRINRKSEQEAHSGTSMLTLQLKQINTKIDQVCLDELNGILDRTDFIRIYHDLCAKRNSLSEKLNAATCEKNIDTPEILAQELAGRFLDEMQNNCELITQLIDRIELTADRQLHIVFRFRRNDVI